MAILQETISESRQGFAKGIAAGAEQIMFDTLQKYQYQYPVKSTIREVACNCIDAINEKIIALSILSGETKVEDHFITRTGELYNDSNWNPEYFDQKYLDPVNNDVEIHYYESDTSSKDQLVIKDYGVGLGDKRLQGYFQLGYSTKRNWKKGIGKWGLGAKAALSTNIPYYKVITRHNGREFQFHVYSYKADSIVPSMDLTTGQVLPHIVFEWIDEHGIKQKTNIHYYPTNKFNGTEVILDVAKHKKNEYIDAINHQLMYFENVLLYMHDNDELVKIERVAAKIFYEDDDIVLSDNNIYSRPHLVIDGVNYNDIDFLELEIEERRGNVGVKVSAEEVEVTPSRESVIWSDRTRKAVLAKFEKVRETANRIIAEEISDEQDYVRWVQKIDTIKRGNTRHASVLSRLADIVSAESIRFPFFKGDKDLMYHGVLFLGHRIRFVTLVNLGTKKVIRRSEAIKHTKDINWDNVYFKDVRTSNKVDTALLALNPQGFYVVEPELDFDTEKIGAIPIEKQISDLEKKFPGASKVINLVKASTAIKKYSEINADDIVAYSDDEDTATESELQLTPEQKRKLDNKILMKSLQMVKSGYGGTYNGKYQAYENFFETTGQEIIEAKHLIIYGTKEDKEELACIAYIVTERDDFTSYGTMYGNTEMSSYANSGIHGAESVDILMVAKNNLQYVEQNPRAIHVRDLYIKFTDGHLTVATMLVQWNTARMIDEQLLDKVKFLNALKYINKDMYKIAMELREYSTKYFQGYPNDVFRNHVAHHLDSLLEMQLFLQEETDEHAIALKSKELFDNEAIKNATSVDLDIYNKLTKLVNFIEPIRVIFNDSDTLTSYDPKPTSELESEYRAYALFKGVELD